MVRLETGRLANTGASGRGGDRRATDGQEGAVDLGVELEAGEGPALAEGGLALDGGRGGDPGVLLGIGEGAVAHGHGLEPVADLAAPGSGGWRG